ncbi:EamA family transporter [Marisediminicola sp. LYQ134]|uniref:EamA family transporter n=1 Tax=Marisediminicola sp. LYQ134 TaxID=3391061 RepID=UPI00398368D1
MTRGAAVSRAIPPWALAIAAISSVQLGSALSVGVIDAVGPAGTAWLRLSIGALVFIAIVRPSFASLRRRDMPAILALGVTTGLVTIAFLSAIDRIPLGTAVAIEFLGPLAVAAIRAQSKVALVFPAVALAGVVLVTEPWHGRVDLLGVGFAALAALGWAGYILLTQRVGDSFTGISALALTVPVAAATAGILGVPQSIGHITVEVLLAAAGLALLLPVIPFALEMIALRRMTATAFGTLMALEPAVGVLLGFLILQQTLTITQGLGIALVVAAGAAAQRTGRREPADPPLPRPEVVD